MTFKIHWDIETKTFKYINQTQSPRLSKLWSDREQEKFQIPRLTIVKTILIFQKYFLNEYTYYVHKFKKLSIQ